MEKKPKKSAKTPTPKTDAAKTKTPKAKAPKAASAPKATKAPKAKKVQEAAPELLPEVTSDATPVLDPIGDISDGEGQTLLAEEPAADEPTYEAQLDSADQSPALDEGLDAAPSASDSEEAEDDESDFVPIARPAGKQERLQKILAQAGVASRRKAEEMIEQGRVQVNGTTVTELGTKADAGHDHIRVDGKLLHGAERLRYFVLNKPRGFVTTVKDPEGRPTVMQFFEKNRERLYPVGRLDYMSEGLLVVTNDGDLANKLTKAGSGVEKTYLVKVAGQPTEDQLDALRGGVSIERGKPGSPMVRTSPARIRQVRQGDNPWFEVVLIEGRNRELRKMFVAVGHFVEKIRRVGYGPLVLDQEPGKMRELEPEELTRLRMAAEGKWKTPKSKDIRRRNAADAVLPTMRPKPSPRRPEERSFERKPFDPKQFESRPAAPPSPGGDFRPKRAFGSSGPARSFDRSRPSDSPRPYRPAEEGSRPPAAGRSFAPRTGARPFVGKPAAGRPTTDRPFAKKPFGDRPPRESSAKPFGDRPAGRSFEDRPSSDRPFTKKPFGDRPAGRPFAGKPGGKPFGDRPSGKPDWKKSGSSDRPPFKRPAPPAREQFPPEEDLTPIPPTRLRIDPIEPDDREMRSPSSSRPGAGRPGSSGRPPYQRQAPGNPGYGAPRAERTRFNQQGPERSAGDRPSFNKPRFDKPSFDRPSSGRPSSGRPSSARPSSGRPSFDRSGSAGRPSAGGRPSFGKPRFEKSGSDRPSSGRPSFDRPRPDRPSFDRPGAGRPSGPPRTGSRPPFDSGDRPAGKKPRWVPRPGAGGSDGPGAGRPSSGSAGPKTGGFSRPKPSGFSRPKPGGFSKPGFKSGPKKGKPGAKKHAGRNPGKKRG